MGWDNSYYHHYFVFRVANIHFIKFLKRKEEN